LPQNKHLINLQRSWYSDDLFSIGKVCALQVLNNFSYETDPCSAGVKIQFKYSSTKKWEFHAIYSSSSAFILKRFARE